jgi:large subunit ribosomal protein L29
MKPEKWRDLSLEEIARRAGELSEEIFNLRVQLSLGIAKSPARVRQAKRDLARALTILRERDLEISRSREGR